MYFTYEQPKIDLSDEKERKRIVDEAYANGVEAAKSGKVADYIPELAKANPDDFGICIKTRAGETIAIGETQKRFSI